MKLALTVFVAAAAMLGGDLAAQGISQSSPAAPVGLGYQRASHLRFDPFRHVMIPHWGFVVSAGASAANNTVNFGDIGAFMFLSDRDSLLIGDVLDALGLVPKGVGVTGGGEAEGGLYLGGPFGRRLSIGFSVQGRGYGGFTLDDDAVALLRDGNGARQEFTLGDSRGEALGTAEAGVHAVVRLGPVGSANGTHVSLGFGGRYIRPLVYARGRSLLSNGGTLVLTGDTIAANIEVESLNTPEFEFDRGSGIAADFLLRIEWPASGFALEGMVANLGKVTMSGLERRTLKVDLATTSLGEVNDVLDTLDLQLQETVDRDVTLPTIVRFSGSAWANRILQLDVSATLPYAGAFEIPLTVDLGSTWRLLRAVPLRLGVVVGGHQGLGYTAGIGVETRNFLLQFAAGSLGGLLKNASGAAGRFELGFFF